MATSATTETGARMPAGSAAAIRPLAAGLGSMAVLALLGAAVRARVTAPVAAHGAVDASGWAADGLMLLAVAAAAALAAPMVVQAASTPAGRGLLAAKALVALALPLTPLGAVAANGARVGVALPLVGTVQVVHAAIVAVVLLVAGNLAHAPPGGRNRSELATLTPMLVVVAVASGLLLLARDLGPAVVLVVAVLLTAAALTHGLRALGLVSAAVAAGGSASLAVSSVARARVAAWADGANDQVAAALAAIADAGWFGHGWADGRAGDIPVVAEDLPLAGVAEHLGAVGVVAIVAAWAALVAAMAVAARRATADGAAVAVALASLVAAQGLIVGAMNLGVLPHSGMTLPLVSAGKSSLLTLAAAVGVALGAPFAVRNDAHRRANDRVPVWFAVVGGVALAARAASLVAGHGVDPVVLATHRAVDALAEGDIVDADGTVLATTTYDANGTPSRALTVSAALGVAGVADPGTFRRGVEAAAAADLACGGPRNLLDWAARRCRPDDVATTIDASLTVAARATVDRHAPTDGDATAVVIDLDGRVLAAVSASDPASAAALRVGGAAQGWTPAAFTVALPPGSTAKPIAFLALDDPATFETPWLTEVQLANGATVRSWQVDGCGTDVSFALRWSCNPATIVAGRAAGADTVADVAGRVGLDGQVPTWPGVPHVAASTLGLRGVDPSVVELGYIGQADARATVAGMAVVAAALGRDDGAAPSGLTVLADHVPGLVPFVHPDKIALVADALRGCPTDGTCPPELDDLAGAKTGTAQHGDGTVGWCIGFAPAEAPAVAFATRLVPTGNGRTTGRQACRLAADLLPHLDSRVARSPR